MVEARSNADADAAFVTAGPTQLLEMMRDIAASSNSATIDAADDVALLGGFRELGMRRGFRCGSPAVACVSSLG